MIKRKTFLQALGAAGLGSVLSFLGYKTKQKLEEIPGEILGANSSFGHLLRQKINKVPEKIISIPTIIVGAGVSGLSASWHLKKNGFHNFKILELHKNSGGNSSFGENSTSKFPLGAHYLPIPDKNAVYVIKLLEDMGIIQGYENNLPIYDPFYLCADPQERLFFQGSWQESLIPTRGINEEDRKEYQEFFNFIESMKTKIGRDGKKAFSIPLEDSSKDKEFLALDEISMYDFMKSKNWNSIPLNWYVEYSSRDDFGVSHKRISAWAGIHYFASRTGRGANCESGSVLTSPEGNGFLVSYLSKFSKDNLVTNTLVYKITEDSKILVDTIHEDGTFLRYECSNLIYAAPRFTAKYIIHDYSKISVPEIEHAPWLIANLTLSERPKGNGVGLAWDNVSCYSRSLGYIVANHQDITTLRNKIVITYYLPLDEESSSIERKKALTRTYEDWMKIILPDLEKMHNGISKTIEFASLWVWGHGMSSPGINYLWSKDRKNMLNDFGKIIFAHSDMSGISIFEEAQYRGILAAKKILRKAN
ncbi:MAG: FAD/NAD(P)-binding protein [Leptospiraceae bacterium]|nr:FAD/NAD(P)-binding protein [Leptospiraceae bacterium]